MKPANGWYGLHTNPPSNITAHYQIDGDGLHTTFGCLVWDEPNNRFVLGGISISFTAGGTFVAINSGTGYGGTYAPA